MNTHFKGIGPPLTGSRRDLSRRSAQECVGINNLKYGKYQYKYEKYRDSRQRRKRLTGNVGAHPTVVSAKRYDFFSSPAQKVTRRFRSFNMVTTVEKVPQ